MAHSKLLSILIIATLYLSNCSQSKIHRTNNILDKFGTIPGYPQLHYLEFKIDTTQKNILEPIEKFHYKKDSIIRIGL